MRRPSRIPNPRVTSSPQQPCEMPAPLARLHKTTSYRRSAALRTSDGLRSSTCVHSILVPTSPYHQKLSHRVPLSSSSNTHVEAHRLPITCTWLSGPPAPFSTRFGNLRRLEDPVAFLLYVWYQGLAKRTTSSVESTFALIVQLEALLDHPQGLLQMSSQVDVNRMRVQWNRDRPQVEFKQA